MKQEQAKIEEKLLGDNLYECGERSQYHNLVDVLFVLDATGSMSWCMDQMKNTINTIMHKFSDNQYNIKFAIQLYRDHPPMEFSYVEQHFDLRNEKQILKVIEEECEVAGGGDIPEAVFDGLVQGLKKTSWRVSVDKKIKSKRFLFHGCDAPPHGLQYGYKSDSAEWTEKGCPCRLTRHDVKKLLDEINVDYSLIKCGDKADVMSSLFKESFGDRFKREIHIPQKQKKKQKELIKKVAYNHYEEEEEGELEENVDMGGLFDGDGVNRAQKRQKAEQKCKPKKKDMASQIAEQMQCGLFGFFD